MVTAGSLSARLDLRFTRQSSSLKSAQNLASGAQDFYAVPAFVKASIASESVGNIRKICSTFVISNTFSTRLFTPVSAMRRPDFAHEVQALTREPSPDESR